MDLGMSPVIDWLILSVIFVYTNGTSDDPSIEISDLAHEMQTDRVDTVGTSNRMSHNPPVEIDFRALSSPDAHEVAGMSASTLTAVDAGLDPVELAIFQVRLLEHFKRVPGRW